MTVSENNAESGIVTGRTRKLLFVVTEDWAFLTHRLPMARAAHSAGWEVHVATSVADHGAAIVAAGFTLHPFRWRRSTRSLFGIAREIRQLRALYRREAFDMIHHVALKPVVIGSLAASGSSVPTANSVVGLGYGFTSRDIKRRVLSRVIAIALRTLLGRPKSVAIVQNPDDREVLLSIGVKPDRITLIPGSGVDTDMLLPTPEPGGPVRAAFVGRMLDDKGVRTLVEAHRLLRQRGVPLLLDLAGEPDPENPTSIKPAELDAWNREPGLAWLGRVNDISGLWARTHIAVLPSRREGLPKSLLEAAACGRPIVATDVPGCRQIARQGVNALLVPPDDPVALADALERLAGDAELRRRYGAASRKLVEQGFTDRDIGALTVALYDRLAGALPLASGRTGL